MHDIGKCSAVLENVVGFARLYAYLYIYIYDPVVLDVY